MPRRVRGQRRRRAQRTFVTRERQRRIEREEHELLRHQRSCFKGAAIVQISDLSVARNGNRLMEDQQNTTRLERVLRIQGCYRLNKAFHAPVVIDAADWTNRRAWFQDPPRLGPDPALPQLCKEPDLNLLALDQNSLIAAAQRRFQELEEESPWWIVDVYVIGSGMSSETPSCSVCPIADSMKMIKLALTRSWSGHCGKTFTKNASPRTGASTKAFASTKVSPVGAVIKPPRTSGGQCCRASPAAERPTTCARSPAR